MNRSEIRRKIEELSQRKKREEIEKKGYSESLSEANKLARELRNSSGYLTNAEKNLLNSFVIGGKGADNKKISKINTEVIGIIKKLEAEIIPVLNRKIKELNEDINEITDRINRLRREYGNVIEEVS